jgi:hypothetical protein
VYIAGPRWRKQRRGPEGWGTWVDPLHLSITKILEQDFIEKILNDLHYRANLFNIKDLDAADALIKSGVELREFRIDLIGDIDVLIVPRGSPERSTAIQVKRFPVNVREDGHDWQRDRMTRLFQKGIIQANYAARAVGFSQVYFWTFVLADTRWQNGGRYTYDGPDSALHSEIRYAMSPVGLDRRVGLVHFEWVQPMDRPPLELATYGGSLENLAARATQPLELTEWLASLTPSAKDLAIYSC